MSLAQVLYPAPTPEGFDTWTFQHNAHHNAIIAAVKQTKNVTLQPQLIYPFNPSDVETWLQNHQQLHDDMESVFKIIGSDLSSLDFQDQSQRDGFFFLNFSSHRDVAIACGLTI